MNVLLTFDVEVWCNDWSRLDERFPAAFQRYVWGRSKRGDYALPKTLEIMARHGLKGVFFVEPLFAARFGLEHLATIVDLIRQAGQDVQLHLHPEWTDEIQPPPIRNAQVKRQHLNLYTLQEQMDLIALGLRLMAQVGLPPMRAFRAGSFACDANTFTALEHHQIGTDSSLNACYEVSGARMGAHANRLSPSWIGGVRSMPVATFLDATGRRRPAQVAGCSFGELIQAMNNASRRGERDFVIVSHNFEMLRPASSAPDGVVVRRFERLCAHLDACRQELPTATFDGCSPADEASRPTEDRTGWPATLVRMAEQSWRRGRDAVLGARS